MFTTRFWSAGTAARVARARPQTTASFFSSRTAHAGSRPAWQRTFQDAQTRQYRRQAFNYQRFDQARSLFQRWAARPTFYYEVGGIGVACGGYYIYNLEEVPVSGRKRFNVVSPDFEKQQGQAMYEQTMQEFGDRIMPPSSREHRQVQRVLERLIPNSVLQDEEWEIHVINDPMKNAFVIPGGKVFVFRGILDVCGGDNGVAAVLGHEIAHNVAHHAAERMSQAVVLLPLGLLAYLFGDAAGMLTRTGLNLLLSLPGSRKQEEEADYVGLLMMAQSCYDPEAAVTLWAKMEKGEQGAPPQFLSTHPSSHNRMEKIRDWLPKAEEKREESNCAITTELANDFRKVVEFPRW